MATPDKVKVFRSNDLSQLKEDIEKFYNNEVPDVLQITHSGTNDILVMIHYK